ncbi:FAD-binding oxidoreductase [Sphingorhabdus lacus]|uniref:FAD-binding oxidoreductase n=1 Tax=Sphingorhabdus lacus TaxID=392610 RepID=A0A6I6L515_9SPHN|nr:FAD-binding oxidoreductase [Sphingorhabdus lacus]QGY79271.1 FAD-binding oxidoreductase [Sphingorhabdus lacus]
MTLPLPPGISSAAFKSALEKFGDAIGSQWVFSTDEDVILYRDAYSPLWDDKEERLPSAAVAPETAEQVQAIVRIANEYKIPLYPISTGKNLGYGGSAPTVSGSVIVDLKRMNKIIEVDDKRHFAIVEPGVSYFDLYDYIQQRGLKVWIDSPDPGWGSLVGNSLDRGCGYTYGGYRDHFDSHSGMEVVLPNGELIRTGMGALPGAKTWAEFPHGFGPSVDGLFAQGNFGIVTKMGFHLMPQPDAYMSGMVYVPRREDLIPLVDIINTLEHLGVTGQPRYGSPLQSLMGEKAFRAEVNSRAGLTNDALNKVAKDRNLASWQVELQFYGASGVVEANWASARSKISAAIPGARFEVLQRYEFPLTQAQRDALPHKAAFGVPDLSIFFVGARSKETPEPGDGFMWFSSVIPKSGEAIFEAQKVYRAAAWDIGIEPGISPFSTPSSWYRTFILISGLPISRSDANVNKQSRQLYEKYAQAAAAAGFGEYRAPAIFHSMVSDTYSFNDHALRRFLETMKDTVDPNGIFAPGRGGIWPKRFREQRS